MALLALPLPALTSFCSGPVVPYPSVISPGMPLPSGLCTCHSLPGMLFTQGPGCCFLISFRPLLRYQDVTWRRLWTCSFKLLPSSSTLASHLLCFISPFSSWHIPSQVFCRFMLTQQPPSLDRQLLWAGTLYLVLCFILRPGTELIYSKAQRISKGVWGSQGEHPESGRENWGAEQAHLHPA